MSSPFTLIIPLESQQRLYALLSVDQLKKAEFQVIKRSAATVRTNVSKIIRQEIALKKEDVDERLAVSVKGDPAEGRITVKGRGIPYSKFPFVDTRNPKGWGTESSGRGVRVTIYRNRGPFMLRHAFAAIMTTGHEGIFLRAKGKDKFGMLTKRGFAQRLPIVEEKAQSLASLVSIPDVWSKIEVDAQSVLSKNAESQIKRFLKGNYTSPEGTN